MKFKAHRNVLNKIMYYASDIERIIIPDPFGHTELDRKLPEYIILKDNKDFHSLRLRDWLTDSMMRSGYITNVNDIYNEYTPIWTGSKTLKEAKEIIEGTHRKI